MGIWRCRRQVLVSGGTCRTIIVMILPRQFLVPFLVPAFLLFHKVHKNLKFDYKFSCTKSGKLLGRSSSFPRQCASCALASAWLTLHIPCFTCYRLKGEGVEGGRSCLNCVKANLAMHVSC